MQSQQTNLDVIANNLANVNTTGFKRDRAVFEDLIYQNYRQVGAAATEQNQLPTGLHMGLGARTVSIGRNFEQGSLQESKNSLDVAINGNGFFAVQKPGNFTDGTPVFDGVDRFTRRGDFQIDKSGYLVNGAGYYLQGVPIDPTTGNPSGSSPQVLRFQNDFLPAQETTRIDYRANLASYPLTTKHDVSVPNRN